MTIRPLIAIGATVLVAAVGTALVAKNVAYPSLVAAPPSPSTEATPEPKQAVKPEPKPTPKAEPQPVVPSGKSGKTDLVMFGGTNSRNMINTIDKNIPDKPDPNDQKLLKWKADLGTLSYGGPTIAQGKVFVGTNNTRPRNKRDIDNYFGRATSKMILRQPLELTENTGKYDIYVNVHGGGLAGQADAIQLGITRALMIINGSFRPALKKAGFVTRDPRIKERKKYGQRGARARYQFSKR